MSDSQGSTAETPAAPKRVPPVIRSPNVAAWIVPAGWRRVIPAWLSSTLLHSLLLLGFLAIGLPAAPDSVRSESAVIETKVDPAKPEANLEETDLGTDPEVPLNFNTPRIEEISVPGPANPNEAVGLPNAADAVPMNITPPPGLGTSQGQGGGLESLAPGKANAVGFPGSIANGLMQPGSFGGRSGATREQLLREGGGNTQSEAAVARALRWLVQHQGPNGNWSLDDFNQYGHCNCSGRGANYDIAATAFGLLPLLGAGQTHRPGPGDSGHLYSKNVERALKFLLLKQSVQGDFGGGMYSHGLATIAVCEAYGLTRDPSLQRAGQRAINFIAYAQDDDGGWRYTPRSGGDTSVLGWQVMALKSAQMAGLSVPPKSLAGAGKWLDLVSSADGSQYRYRPGQGPTPTMTAVGLLCRQYLGWGPRNPGLQAGIKRLQRVPPAAANTIYYTYYATQVMHHMGGAAWESWNSQMRDYLISLQDRGSRKPHQMGSWSPQGDVWGREGGRVMETSLAVLTLEVYYRHLPLYRREQMAGVRGD